MRVRVRLSGLDVGATWSLDYQERGVNLGTSSWTPVATGLSDESRSFEIAYRRDVLFRATIRDRGGLTVRVLYQQLAVEQEAAEEVPAPDAVEIAPKGNALEVSVQAPSTPSAPAEQAYDVEVRSGASSPVDSIPYSHEGVLADPPRGPYGCCGVPVPVCPGATSQWVHARLRRRADGRPGPWLSVQPVLPPVDDHGELVDDDTAFAGTIEATGAWPHLEVAAGKLRFAAIPADNYAGANADDDGTFPLDNMGARFTRGYYQTADATHDQVVDWEPVICPELDPLTRTAILDNNTVEVPLPIAAEGEDPVDTRRLEIPDDSSTHAEPPRIEVEISETQDGAAYGSFEPWVPGRVKVSKGYRARVHLATRLPLQIPVAALRLRRRRRNHKWEFDVPINVANGDKTYTFSPVPSVMSTASLRATATPNDALLDPKVTYMARVISVSATAVRILVTQVCRDTVVTAGGVAVWTYPQAFGAVPHITCSPQDVTHTIFSGIDTPGAAAVNIYATTHAGAAADVDVDCHAIGPPPSGVLSVHVVLTGW